METFWEDLEGVQEVRCFEKILTDIILNPKNSGAFGAKTYLISCFASHVSNFFQNRENYVVMGREARNQFHPALLGTGIDLKSSTNARILLVLCGENTKNFKTSFSFCSTRATGRCLTESNKKRNGKCFPPKTSVSGCGNYIFVISSNLKTYSNVYF